MQVPDSPNLVTPAPEWTFVQKCRILLWEWSWILLACWTPKPFNPWRLLLLRAFGAQIKGRPFVHPKARIQVPWNLKLADRACIGSRADLYTLDRLEIGPHSIVAQEAYLCTGTHRRGENGTFPLYTAPIAIGSDCFIGARAFVLPGVVIGDRATLGAASVLTRNLPSGETWAGNPARAIPRAHS